MTSICAIIAVHNADRTLDRVLEHLGRNRIDVHVVDHGSTDGTRDVADRRRVPEARRTTMAFDGVFRLREQLSVKEEVVRSLEHDWVIHADADEIMESPRPGESLRGMIERVDRDGFDVIDCDEFVFVPRDGGEPVRDFIEDLRRYYHFAPRGRTVHRVQRLRGASLDWSSSGGHRLSLAGRSVAPDKIRIRHYIGLTLDHLRSQYLGRVFDAGELAQGWHANRVPTTPDFIAEPDPSRLFDVDDDGWNTTRPEPAHLLFHQPAPYIAPTPLRVATDRAPFPFVVGVGRCGTTLLRLMIDAHPDIAMTPETHWLRPALSALATHPDEPEVALERIRTDETWHDMRIPERRLREIFGEHDRAAPFDTLRRIYADYGRDHGAQRTGDKTPVHGLGLLQIAAALPEVRFIHIIRDGRDVATSFRDLWFGPGSGARDAAVFWMWRLREIRQQAQFYPGYLEVRYEDLVQSPERVLREIGAFIDLPFHEAQLTAHRRAEERLRELRDVTRGESVIPAERRRGIHALTSHEPDPSRVGRWRHAMSREDVAAFEDIAGDMLTDLGYARAAG